MIHIGNDNNNNISLMTQETVDVYGSVITIKEKQFILKVTN